MSDRHEPLPASDPGLFGADARRGFARPSSISATYRTPWDNPDPTDTAVGEAEYIRRSLASRDEAAVRRQNREMDAWIAEQTAPEGRTA